jgi:phosphomannomutase
MRIFEKTKQHKVREKMVEILEKKFGESLGLQFSIGGQISIDVFPKGGTEELNRMSL